MDKSLTFFRNSLRTSISDLCELIRNHSLPAEGIKLQEALGRVVYFTMLEDELNRLLSSEQALVVTVNRYLQGEPFVPADFILTGIGGQTAELSVYDYCHSFFTRTNCPLGTASKELSNWIESYVDQQQSVREFFIQFFPDFRLLFGAVDADGELVTRPASDIELFDARTRGLLDDIERNQALVEFNDRMLAVKDLLEQHAPAYQLLTLLLNESEDEHPSQDRDTL